MRDLVQVGRLCYPKEVVAELERSADKRSPDQQFEWAKSNEEKACEHSAGLDVVSEVLEKVPKVLDPEKDAGADEADPYVLAMACHLLAQGASVRIVTEEKNDMPRKMSLRTAAGLLGIPSVPLRAFLEFEKII